MREVFLLSPNGNYIKHTYPGSSQSGNASWSVQWTAPASAVHDPVTFYAAGNEANGDSTNQGGLYLYGYGSSKQCRCDSCYVANCIADIAAFTIAWGIADAAPLPPPTLPPLPSAVAAPTSSECEPKSISTVPAKILKLKPGKSVTITVTVSGSEGCNPAGVTVNAAIKTGEKRVTLDRESATTDENGQATFTITAGRKKGNAKVAFTVEDGEGKVSKTFVIVQIRKKLF